MIDDVLEDRDTALARTFPWARGRRRAGVRAVVGSLRGARAADRAEQFVGRRQRLALHRREGAAVHVVAGDAFGQFGADRVHGRRDLVDDVAHQVDPLRREQHGAHLVPGVPGASDHLLPLGDEQALGRLPPAPELDVGQTDVVAQAGVVGVVDGDEISHRLILPCPVCGANGLEEDPLPLVTRWCGRCPPSDRPRRPRR